MSRRHSIRGLIAVVVGLAGAGCGDDPAPGDDAAPVTVDMIDAGATDGSDGATTDGSTATTDGDSSGGSEANGGGQQPEGFTTVTARITDADGEVCEVCLWLADDGTERGRGLMDVTDLGDAAGMAFRFDQPVLGAFYMFQTPMPLSIAWFAPDGSHVGSAEMEPCLDTLSAECPRYSPDDEYDLAVETFAGGLAELGVGPGAVIELLPDTESPTCLLAPT